MKLRPLVGLTCALVAVAAASCTDSTSGSPQPSATSTTSTSASAPTTSKSGVFPPRPRDVDLIGVDPCKALTPAQSKELDYDAGYQLKPMPTTDGITGAPACTYSSSNRNTGALVIPITTEGAEEWLTNPDRETNEKPTKTTVAGFPALELKAPDTKSCKVMLDVHDGQQLDVLSSDLGGGPKGLEAYCEEAKKVAGMVLETVESGR